MAPNLHLWFLLYASVTLMPFFRSHAQMKQLPASACTSFSSASAWGDSGTEATCRRRLRSANRNIQYVKNSEVCTCKYARKGCHSTIEERQFQRSSKHVWVSHPAQLLCQDCNQPVRRKTRSHAFQGFQCCSSNCITCCASQTLSRDVPSILCTHRGHKMTPQNLPVSQWFTSFCFLFQFLMACMSHVSVCFHARYVCLMQCIEMQDLSRSRTTYTGPDSEIKSNYATQAYTMLVNWGQKLESNYAKQLQKGSPKHKEAVSWFQRGLVGTEAGWLRLADSPMLNQDTRWYIQHHSTYFTKVCFKASAK